MDIEKLQNQIEKLPKKEKQAIQKIGELNDSEMEEAVGGLSDRAKNILMILGALGAAATIGGGAGAYLGYKSGHKSGYKSGRQEAINQMRKRTAKR